MSVVLELPPELETELVKEAAGRGLPLEQYVLGLLQTIKGPSSMPRTGAELLAYWNVEGVVGTRLDISDSQAHARSLRQQAEKRERT